MPTFSANLGFLWQEHTLADAIRAAHTAGFNAVECHFPYNEPTLYFLVFLVFRFNQ